MSNPKARVDAGSYGGTEEKCERYTYVHQQTNGDLLSVYTSTHVLNGLGNKHIIYYLFPTWYFKLLVQTSPTFIKLLKTKK